MQYNHIISLNKIRKSRTFSVGIKLTVFVLVSVYIYHVVRNKQDLNAALKAALSLFFQNHALLLVIPVVLLFANWAIEAWKWKFLSEKLEKISFWKAFRGVFTGVALSFVTPLGIGDYVGRILHLNHSDRGRSLGAVFLCRAVQFYVTLFCGGIAIAFYLLVIEKQGAAYSFVMLFFIFLTYFFLLFSLFFYKKMIALTAKVPLVKKLYPYLSIILEYQPDEVRHVIVLSFIRYAVFTIQYMILLRMFGVFIPWDVMLAGIFFIFIARSVIPTLFDLGVRESAAVFFFSSFTTVEENILFASLSLWVINLLIPSLIGLFFILKLKIFPES